MHFDTRLLVGIVALDELEPPLAAREERPGHLGEVRLHRGERLVEAPLDGLGQLVAQLLELLERRLEVGALRRELLEPRLLRVVLLLRERVHLAEPFAPALETLRDRGALIAVAPSRALVGPRVLEPAPRLVGLRLDARHLDVDRGNA